MGLFDAFKNRKKKATENPAGSEADALLTLDGADLSGIEPPETRYTQEYQDFLASQEAAAETDRSASSAEADYPSVSPEGFCAQFDRCATSLIEEPETCEVCVFFCDRDNTCRRPERMQ